MPEAKSSPHANIQSTRSFRLDQESADEQQGINTCIYEINIHWSIYSSSTVQTVISFIQ